MLRKQLVPAVAALALSVAAGVASAQTGGVTFKFFTGSNGTKPDLISRQVEYAPGSSAYGSIKAWSGMTATAGFDTSSTESNDLFGFSATSAGDVDGDGYDDIVVGAPLSNAGGTASGRIDIFSAVTGAKLKSISGFTGQLVGMSVAGVGDFDGDGHSDIAASGRLSTGTTTTDAVFIYSSGNGDLLRAYNTTNNDGFGYLVRGMGDLNGDGAPEVAVVAPRRYNAGSTVAHVEVDILSPAAAGDERIRLKLADAEQCVIDVNVVVLSGVSYIDVVTMTTEKVYTHNLFSLSGVKVETSADTDIYRFTDVNKDNKIDQDDIWLILSKLSTESEAGSPFNVDVNKDGVIDENDLNDVVNASTQTPILKELSYFAQNRLQEMEEQFPLYFGLTEVTDQTTAEQTIGDKKDDCKQCPTGQRKGCDGKCCGPGGWVWIRGTPTTTQTATMNGSNIAASATTLSVPNAQSCSGSITLNDDVPRVGLTSLVVSSLATSTVSWNVTDKEVWSGSGTACARAFNTVISGNGALGLSLLVEAHAGNSASGGASGSVTGTGFGGSAGMTMVPISGSVSVTQVAGSEAMSLSLSATPSAAVAIPPGGGTPGNGQMGGSIGVSASAANSSTVTGNSTLAITGSFSVIGRYPADGSQVCTDSVVTDTNNGILKANDAVTGFQVGLFYGWYHATALVTAEANMQITP